MAIINSYPIGTPKTNDLLVGTSMPLAGTDADPITKNFPVSDIISLAATGNLPNLTLGSVYVGTGLSTPV